MMTFRVPRTRLSRWAHRHPFFTAFLAMTVVVVVGIVRTQQIASQQSQDKAAIVKRLDHRVSCINNSLAFRQRTIDLDHGAEVRKVQEQKLALADQVMGLGEIVSGDVRRGLTLYQRGTTEFQTSLDHYLAAIAVTDKLRQQHPLGKC